MTVADGTPSLTQVGISEESLRLLVERFYARVRLDPLIGPVFDKAIGDWPEHLDKLQAFWSSVMLTSGRYKGRPLPAHIKHAAEIDHRSFERWLALWKETTDAMLDAASAAALQDKAARIAESLQLGIQFSKDRLAALLADAGLAEPASRLPEEVLSYKRTPEFTEATVPAGLLKTHSTKAGVWGLIRVIEGELLYRVVDERRVARQFILTPSSRGIVEPEIRHEVEAAGPVRFFVEFLRAAQPGYDPPPNVDLHRS